MEERTEGGVVGSYDALRILNRHVRVGIVHVLLKLHSPHAPVDPDERHQPAGLQPIDGSLQFQTGPPRLTRFTLGTDERTGVVAAAHP